MLLFIMTPGLPTRADGIFEARMGSTKLSLLFNEPSNPPSWFSSSSSANGMSNDDTGGRCYWLKLFPFSPPGEALFTGSSNTGSDRKWWVSVHCGKWMGHMTGSGRSKANKNKQITLKNINNQSTKSNNYSFEISKTNHALIWTNQIPCYN